LGRKLGVSDVGSHFKLADYQTDPFPKDNGSPVDYTSGVVDFGMQGNDTVGDCGVAGDVHTCQANAWTAGEQRPGNIASTVWPTSAETVAAYFTYTGGQDTGVDLGQWLLYRMTHSIGPIGPIGGFAQVADGGNEYEGALRTFKALYTGISVSQDLMDEFEAGQPWTSLSTNWIGGHCVPHLARNRKWGRLITWGADELFSWPCWDVIKQEAYVIFTPAQMEAPGGVFAGVAVAKLKEDIKALHGTL
jgi:hypothetical protein